MAAFEIGFHCFIGITYSRQESHILDYHIIFVATQFSSYHFLYRSWIIMLKKILNCGIVVKL